MEKMGAGSESEDLRTRNIDKIIKDLKETPLFMDEITDEVIKNNPIVEALVNLSKESDPEDQFYTLKSHGDECFYGGCDQYKISKSHYIKALEIDSGSLEHRASIHRNLAIVENHLGNYGSSIKHCQKVLEVFPKDVQSLYNLAFAKLKLDRYEEAETHLEVIAGESRVARDLLENVKSKKKEALYKKISQDKIKQQKLNTEKNLLKRIKDSGVNMYNELESVMFNGIESKVEFDLESGCLIWPVVLYYPEHKVSEFIARFNEYSTFSDHLSVMFNSERAPWDIGDCYKCDTIEVFFEPMLSDEVTKLVKPLAFQVDKTLSLHQILKHPRMTVVNGCPSFFLLSKSSPFFKNMLRKYQILQVTSC